MGNIEYYKGDLNMKVSLYISDEAVCKDLTALLKKRYNLKLVGLIRFFLYNPKHLDTINDMIDPFDPAYRFQKRMPYDRRSAELIKKRKKLKGYKVGDPLGNSRVFVDVDMPEDLEQEIEYDPNVKVVAETEEMLLKELGIIKPKKKVMVRKKK